MCQISHAQRTCGIWWIRRCSTAATSLSLQSLTPPLKPACAAKLQCWSNFSPGKTGQTSVLVRVTTRWTSRVSVHRHFEGHVTKLAPHQDLKLIVWCKLTFDERVVVHRADGRFCPVGDFAKNRRRLRFKPYRGTSLIRNSTPIAPYSRNMPRGPMVVLGGAAVSYG